MRFADISARPDDRIVANPAERDAEPIDLRRLAAQLRGEAG
jgi:hypothetical protein